ncbi:MAG: protein kinase, partial [Candidatus Eiseniibacteriota bacterium]
MIGKTISHYKILEKLGEGGMGVVYKAEDTKLDRTVALKFLPQNLMSDDEARTRFIHEAKAASALDHPNIATIYEIDEAEGEVFISMAYVDGNRLKDVIGRGTLPIEEILDSAIQIAEGLGAAHTKGIVHRDIKSDNIMLTSDSVAKIMDFGLAKLRGVPGLTKPGSTVGTVSYMSPEQCQGGEVDERSDIFSFGVVLYEMITGQLPFTGEHEAAVMYSIVNQEPRSLSELRRDVPDELVGIVQKALEKERSRRFQRVGEMLRELKRLKERLVSTRVAPQLPSKRGRRFLVPILILVIVALALVVGIRIQVGRQPTAVAEENSLAVMYFDNLAEPEDPGRLGEIVTNLLITDLSESRYVQVVSSQRLYDILKLLGREGAKVIDREVASQVAERANAKWMLLGSILKVEPQTVLTAQLVEVSTGKAVASQRITGEPGEEIFSLVDKLTVEIREDLSLPTAAREEADRPVSVVTTHSADAYRSYIQGEDYSLRYYATDAERSYRRAIEFDSTFAMAYYALSFWGPEDESGQHIANALKYVDRVTRREKHYILARDAYLSGDYATVVSEHQQVLERHPNDKRALLWTSVGYGKLGQPEKAIQYANRLVEVDPLFKEAYNQLAYVYNDAGDLDRSIWAINKYISMVPDEPNPYDTRGDLYAFNGRIDEAIDSYEKAVEIKPDFSLAKLGHMHLFKRQYAAAETYYLRLSHDPSKYARSRGRVFLALIPLYQGKFEQALKVLEDGIAADRLEQIEGVQTAVKHGLKALIHEKRGETQLSLEQGERMIAVVEGAHGRSHAALQGIYIYVLARCGKIEEAERVLQDLKGRAVPGKSGLSYA